MPKRLTLDNAKEIARQRGGVCLSDKYTNGYSPMQWKCTKDHIWTATFDSIKHQRSWCPYCAGKIRQTLETAKMIAFNKGGDCISNKYINNKSYLRWKCARNH